MAIGLTGTSSSVYDPYRNFPQTAKERREARIQEFGTTGTEMLPGQTDTTDETDPAAAENTDVVSELRSTDIEVHSHEAAHMAAGGSHITGGASYSYQTGPDGKRYAVGGEVGIDVSPVSGNPRATIAKMMMVQAAALAPANPSPQDLSVAAAAAQMEADARSDLAAQTQALISETQPTGKPVSGPYAAPAKPTGQHVNAKA
jgi:hypothetical protein